MSPFYVVPIEIQKKIIELLVTKENLLSLKLVSKKFKRLVEQVYDHNQPSGKHFWWNTTNGNHKEVARLLQDEQIMQVFNQYNYFENVCDLELVRSLMDDPRVDPSIGRDPPILYEYGYGKMGVFEYLWNHPRVDLQVDDIFTIGSVAGMLGLVQLLLSSKRVTISRELIYKGIKGACREVKHLLLHFS